MEVKKNSLKAWFLAMRPKTLTGAATPVLIAGVMSAFHLHMDMARFPFLPFILCLIFAWVMQVAANFVNDWYDYRRGTDGEERLGPRRACASGWVTPRAMLVATCVTLFLALLVGLPLAVYGGKAMLLVGASCLLFCVLYTTFFSYKGLGDILVILFFGIIPVCVTYYLLTGSVGWQVSFIAVGTGLVVDCLLIVNNYRDRFTDEACGKRTLIVRLGSFWAERLYLVCGVAGVCSAIPFLVSLQWWSFLLMLPYLFLHFTTWRKMVAIGKGKALNAVLGETARNIFVYGLSFVALLGCHLFV
jgi:1,4-dihydroxy-2-naphthoate octaprenyltransferase